MRTADEQHAAILTTWVSVAVNLVLVTVQVAVGIFARSQALVADGLHSASDLVADAVVLVAARQGNVAADETHPYGHMRFENFASLVLGAILVLTGIGMAWSAGNRLLGGTTLAAVHPAAFVIALLTLVCKEALFRYMRRVGERLQSSMLVANAWHARADAASSLVVAVGIAGNLIGVHSMDAAAAAVVGVMVARSGLQFAAPAFRDLTDHSLAPEEMHAIERTILGIEGVRGVHELRTRRMGDWATVDVHVLVGSRLSVSEGHFIAERVRDAVRGEHRVIEAVVHIDPADANDIDRLLTRPARGAFMRELRNSLSEPVLERHVHRLHYLDTGVEIEVDLASDTTPSEQAAVERALHALAEHHGEHVVRLTVSRRTRANDVAATEHGPANVG